jgi:iron complex outermembrane receptor protein
MRVPSINVGTPGEIYVTLGGQDQTLWTQEIRLNRDDADSRVQWVLGVYASGEDNDNVRNRIMPFSGGIDDYLETAVEVFNAAIFGEATVQLAPQWKAVAGARFDYTDVETSYLFSRDFTDPLFPDSNGSAAADNSEDTLLPKAGLVWDYVDNQSLGLTIQRGFRSGGVAINTVALAPYTFDPEYTWNYELSYRSDWLQGDLVVNANVFYTDWSDQQVQVQLVPGDFASSVILNAGKSHVSGGELEANYRISRSLGMFLSVGHVRSRFDDFNSEVGDLSGFPFPEAPEWTIASGLEYEHASGFFAGFDGRKVSGYFARDIQNAPPDRVGDYFVGNARLGWRSDKWTVTLFSDNVFNEEYFVYREVFGPFDCCATLGNRRVTGVTVSANF